MDINQAIREFRPGKYNHYKGGQYTALFLAWDHDTREVQVVYASLKYGSINVRPLATPGKDSWTDEVNWSDTPGVRLMAPRFVRINDEEQPR